MPSFRRSGLFEIANSIFVSYSKRKRITGQQIGEYLDLLKALPIRVEPQSMVENVDLESFSRRLDIAVYDAAYLHLALRMNLALATSDGPLREVAIAADGSPTTGIVGATNSSEVVQELESAL